MGGACSFCGTDSQTQEDTQDHAKHNQKSSAYAVPQKKALDFEFRKDFKDIFSVGKELGKGQYGTTFE